MQRSCWAYFLKQVAESPRRKSCPRPYAHLIYTCIVFQNSFFLTIRKNYQKVIVKHPMHAGSVYPTSWQSKLPVHRWSLGSDSEEGERWVRLTGCGVGGEGWLLKVEAWSGVIDQLRMFEGRAGAWRSRVTAVIASGRTVWTCLPFNLQYCCLIQEASPHFLLTMKEAAIHKQWKREGSSHYACSAACSDRAVPKKPQQL